MKKQIITIATVEKNGIIQKIGKSIMMMPKVNYIQSEIKWFDDNKLLKLEEVYKNESMGNCS